MALVDVMREVLYPRLQPSLYCGREYVVGGYVMNYHIIFQPRVACVLICSVVLQKKQRANSRHENRLIPTAQPPEGLDCQTC